VTTPTASAAALIVAAPAKLNLTLRVGPRRTDGYHEIESLIIRCRDLCDELHVWPRTDGRIELECDDPSLPAGESNLVIRAARALERAARPREPLGATIRLRKRIPSGAGLGGGSADAAATLHALDVVWRLGLTPDELERAAVEIGSDVPALVRGGSCVVRGRGERVEPAGVRIEAAALLVLPPIHCATDEVYAAFDALPPPPERPQAALLLARAGPPRWATRAAERIAEGDALMPMLFNDLEPAATAARPRLGALAARLREITGVELRMSGSGSTLFRLFAPGDAGLRAARDVQAEISARIPRLRTMLTQLGRD
jgi:4-diphosphocytidyl-2-C-methyl-D-erythritol kinase